jgi:SulP family sulfate permease
LSGLIAALFTLGVVLFASGLLRNLPQPVLAAIVHAAVMSLVDLHALRGIWRFSRVEFLIAVAAFAGVLAAGPANGVLIGAAISIVLLLRQAARPRVIELGRIADTPAFGDLSRHPEHGRVPGALVVRCESALVYFNVDYARDRVMQLLASRADAVRVVVLFLGSVPRVDLAGAELIVELRRSLGARGVDFMLAEVHGEVRDSLRRIGYAQAVGAVDAAETIDQVLARWQTGAVTHDAAAAHVTG